MKKLTLLSFMMCCLTSVFSQNREIINAIENNNITDKEANVIFNQIKFFPDGTQVSIAFIESRITNFIGLKKENDSVFIVDNKDKIFEIGSLTKVFTATLLGNIIQDGQIKLDEPINKYLDTKINTDKTITFKQLANHTSGLPRLPLNLNLFTADPNNPYKNYDAEHLKSYLTGDVKLNNEPGSAYEYSNLGAGLLGYILTQISDSSYEQLLQNYIFSKYKMMNSTTDIDKIKANLIKGLNAQGYETPNWDLNSLVAAGGIYSSVQDLSKFILAQFNADDLALKATHQKTFEISDNMSIALAWHIIKRPNGQKYLWHNGGTGGYTSSAVMNLDDNRAVIILSNVSAFHPKSSNIDKLSIGLLDQ